MKRHILTLLLPILLLVQSCFVLSPSSVHGQEDKTLAEATFQIDFPGGPIDEYVKILRKSPNFDSESQKIPVNILVTESAKNFQLPEIRVYTNMEGALGLLHSCSDENAEVIVDSTPGGNITTIRVNNFEQPTVTVINAKNLLKNMDEKELLEVIDVGLDMQGNTTRVDLKLHQKTGLLFAKGTDRATELVHNIVRELTGNSNFGVGPGMRGGLGAGGLGGLGGGGMGGAGAGSGRGSGLGGGMGPGAGSGIGPGGGENRGGGGRPKADGGGNRPTKGGGRGTQPKTKGR